MAAGWLGWVTPNRTQTKTEEPTPVTTPSMTVPVARGVEQVPLSENELTLYQKMAQQVGFRPAELARIEVLFFLRDSGITVYDTTEVEKFLSQRYDKSGKRWAWRPLRRADLVEGTFLLDATETKRHAYKARNWDDFAARIYAHPIPFSVLSSVQRIIERFPTALFFVSDVDVVRPDPFIMVLDGDHAPIIFGHWDEPGFGVGKGEAGG